MTETKTASKAPAKRTPKRKKTVTFVSPYPDQKVIKEKADRRKDAGGNVIEEIAGHTIEFENGQFSTDDTGTIKFLREHSEIGSSFTEVGEPIEPSPTAAEQYVKIGTLAGQLNVDGLRELIEGEETTHNRTPILEAADNALEAIAEGGVPGPDGEVPSTSGS